MKIVMGSGINSPSVKDTIEQLTKGFETEGCTDVKITSVKPGLFKLECKLPKSSELCTSYISYLYDKVPNDDKATERYHTTTKPKFEDSWTFSPDGKVLDRNKKVIGEVVRVHIYESGNYIYKPKDIEVDKSTLGAGVNDIIIKRLQNRMDYQEAVKRLKSRIFKIY